MKKKWWIPIIMILFFGIESIFSIFFPAHLFSVEWIFVPRLIFIFLLFLAVYYDEKLAIIYAITLGVIMDIVFIEIMGIYLFFYPVIVFGISRLMKVMQNHLIIMAFQTVFSIVVLEFGLYGIFYLLQITDYGVERFVNDRLFPTLMLNIVFFIFISYPLKKYLSNIKKVKEEEEGMFQSS